MRILTLAVAAALISAPSAPAQHGSIDANESLFTVMAAINAAGYDAELDSPTNHPLRKQIRSYLANRNLASAERLKEFYSGVKLDNEAADLGQFISFALVCDGPPGFGFETLDFDMPPDVQRLGEFSPLLAEFYREADIASIYQKIQPAIEEFAGIYHGPVSESLFELNGYLRNPTSGVAGRAFQIVLSLLAAPNQIHTRSYASNYYVVVSPSSAIQIEDVRYTYLHYVLEPVVSRAQEALEGIRPLGDYALGAPHLPEHYKYDFQLQATSSLIKAIQARLTNEPPEDKESRVDRAYRQGYILAPAFYEQLSGYEKQDTAMRLYFREMVEAIDLAKEEARAQTLEFDQRKPVRKVKPAVRPEPEMSAAAKSLERAEELYRNRDLEAARKIFLEVQQQTADRQLQARAYYGLARVATLENNAELAVSLFERSLELRPTPPDRSWILVYLGRLSDLAGDSDAARNYYREALAVDGGSEKARETARQGAAGAFRRP